METAYTNLTSYRQGLDTRGYEIDYLEDDYMESSRGIISIPNAIVRSRDSSWDYTQEYDPYAKNDLILDFANTTHEIESIVNFVNTYGLIFSENFYSTSTNQNLETKKLLYRGDRVSRFTEELLSFRACFYIWECLSHGDSKTVEKALDRSSIEITESGRVTYSYGRSKASSQMKLMDQPSGFSSEKKIDWAFQYLRHEINRGMSHHPIRLTMSSIQRTPSSKRVLEFGMSTSSLAGVLWHRLGQLVTDGQAVRRCVQCDSWFRVSGRGIDQKQYCSGACRVAAHRQRKR